MAIIIAPSWGICQAQEAEKNDNSTTRIVHLRLVLEQRASMNEDGWFIVPLGSIKLKAFSNVSLKVVQFYVIKAKSGETPIRIKDDADAEDGFSAEFTTTEETIWHFWASANTINNERLVSNTLRVITERREEKIKKH